MRLRLISLFAGIEGFGLGFQQAGCEVVAQVEIDGFCGSLLTKHHPEVPRFGDIRGVKGSDLPPADIVAGGVPCQDFSVAGRRAGLAGARSGLFFEFARLVTERRPRWLVFENVPGLLSSPPGHGGEDFATVLGELTGFYPGVPAGGWRNSGICVGPRYGVAWRVLDAEYFGLAQRRERVFIVGHSGGVARAVQVLFEPESCDGDSPPSREKGTQVAALAANGVGTCGADDNQAQAGHLIAVSEVAHTLTARHNSGEDGSGRGIPLIAYQDLGGKVYLADHAHTLRANANRNYQLVTGTAPSASLPMSSRIATGDVMPTLTRGGSEGPLALVVFDPTQITSPGNYSSPKPGGPCHPLAAGAEPPMVISVGKGSGPTYADGLAAPITGRHADPGCVAVLPISEVGKRCGSRADERDGLGVGDEGDPMFTLQAGAQHGVMAFTERTRADGRNVECQEDLAYALTNPGDGGRPSSRCIAGESFVRRLTPRECERLQGFPDDYTLLDENTKDSPRYRALGNAVAVPVVKWIAERLVRVDSLPDKWWKEARP